MKQAKTPAVATWILEHMPLGVCDEALAGDLLEDFRQGRSLPWFWRQVLVAILLGFFKEIRSQWTAAAFAFLWTLPVPAFWFLMVLKLERSTFITREWQLPWPYSTLCELAFAGACQFLYVWAGLSIYLLLHSVVTRSFDVRRLIQGIWISGCFSMLFFVTSLAAYLVFGSSGIGFDVRNMSALRLITNSHFILFRVPFFFALLLSIWAVFPKRWDTSGALAQTGL
jgi:hypothetical protein